MSQQTRSRNQNRGMIKENTPMPVQILGCEEGNLTYKGTPTLRYTFCHLDSSEEFQSTVFENSAPLYISEEILDAVLPGDIVEYSLQDLIGKGLMVEVTFKNTDNATFINVVKVAPLNTEYQQTLLELKDSKERARKELKEMLKVMEQEMEVQENHIELDDRDFEMEDPDIDPDEPNSEGDFDFELDEYETDPDEAHSEDEGLDTDFDGTVFADFVRKPKKSR